MIDQMRALLCPHCGLLFFGGLTKIMERCPVCEQRFKVRSEMLLEARLEQECYDE